MEEGVVCEGEMGSLHFGVQSRGLVLYAADPTTDDREPIFNAHRYDQEKIGPSK